MGFSEAKFLSLPPKSRAKKLADLLRVLMLRLGDDWKHAQAEYEKLVQWHAPESHQLHLGNSTPHAKVLDLYHHWRSEAGLGPERDMYLEQDPGDRDTPLASPVLWSVLAHNLRSAYNVGSLIRSVDCFCLESINVSGYTPDISHTALRSAARGAEQWVCCKRWESPLDCIQHYHNHGYAIIALETGENAIPLPQFDWPEKGLIVLGNEELGIATELLSLCTHIVEIPMRGRKASLNVASAFAIAASFLDLKRRQGNAIAIALLVLVCATLFASAIMTGTSNTSMLANRNLNRVQAKYIAESALRWKAGQFPWNESDSSLPLEPRLINFPSLPKVQVDSSEIWLGMSSIATFHEETISISAHLGVPLSLNAFQPAIKLVTNQPIKDEGSFRVMGKLELNNQGGPGSPSKIMDWASKITQRIWSQRRTRMGVATHPDSLNSCGEKCVRGSQSISRNSDFPESMEWRVINGDLRLDLGYTGNATPVAGHRSFIVQGAVLVRGNISFDTLEIIASGPVTIQGEVKARYLNIATEGRLIVEGENQFEGILLAQGDIEIRGREKITGRSWISAFRQAPDPDAGSGKVLIQGGARVEGWVSSLTPNEGVLWVDNRSQLVGIAIATKAIQNEGDIFGVALSSRLQCATSETENCGGSGEFNRDSLPVGFLQPASLDLGVPRKLVAFQWRAE